MAFQTKNFVSIVAGSLNRMRAATDKITDFRPGSVARTLIEGPAIELEEFYQQMFIGLREAIPVATFQSFDFDRLPARRAFGHVSVAAASPLADAITIPIGTAFSTAAGVSYTSTAAVTWAVGSSLVSVPVQAVAAGLSGNANAGDIVLCDLFPSADGYTVGNSAITNGADIESPAEQEIRFADYIAALSRGTVTACLYAAKTATVLGEDGAIDEYVTRSGYDEIPGRIRIWIYSNQGVASDELVAAAVRLLDGYRTLDDVIVPGYRPGGVRVDVLKMAERAVPLSILVGMLDGYELTTSVEQALSDVYATNIDAVEAGSTLLLNDLRTSLLAVAGVSKIVIQSTENITCGASEALTPGALTIGAL